MNGLFLNYITDFQKLHGGQHYPVKMIENLKSAVVQVILSVSCLWIPQNLFLTINHDFLPAKFQDCGFSIDGGTPMWTYLKHHTGSPQQVATVQYI